MVFTKHGKELWVASGNSIAIIDVSNLQLIQQIKVFALARQMVTQLVTDDERVWTIDRKSSIIYEWDVENRKKQFEFDCDVESNARGCVLVQAISDRLFEEITDSPPMSLKNRRATVVTSNVIEENNKPLDLLQPNVEPPINLLKISPSLIKATKKLHAQPSIMFSQRKKKLGKKMRTMHYDSGTASQLRSRTTAYNDTSMRLGPLLLVGDTLWVGRGVGDILVINIKKPSSGMVSTSIDYKEKAKNMPFVFGEVLCHLEDEQGKQPHILKETTQLLKIGKNHVVTAIRVESKHDRFTERLNTNRTMRKDSTQDRSSEYFKLSIFEAWQRSDLERFSGNLSALHALE